MVDSSSWNSAPNYTISAKTTSTVRRSITVNFPENGQYDIQIRRLTEDSDETNVLNETWWHQLKSVEYSNPVKKAGVALTAVRIKASEQLSNTIDDLSGIAECLVPAFDGVNWPENPTTNPAHLFRAILQSNGQKNPVPDEQLDLEAIENWANWCFEQDYRCNFVFDKRQSTWDALRIVAACGRAAPTAVGGKWAPVVQRPQPAPVQLFTPRNLTSWSGKRMWVDLPDALRITFVDETNDYQQLTRNVYRDGFDETNAQKFEDTELPGITHPDLIYRFGRFRLAEAILRPESYTGETDLEHLVCSRGDLVRVAHDSTLWGTAWGRILKLWLNNETSTHIVSIELDELVTLAPGVPYAVRIRHLEGQYTRNIQNTGAGHILSFDSPVLLSSAPFSVGDLVAVGRRQQETFELLVQSITPGGDLSARIAFVPYSPGIFTADTEAIPDWNPGITEIPGSRVPIITSIRSGEMVGKRMADGSVLVLVLVSLYDDGSRPLTTIEGVELRWQVVDSGGAWRYVNAPAEAREITIADCEDGEVIRVACRYRFTSGKPGRWSPAQEHAVDGPDIPPPNVESMFIDGQDIAWSSPNPPPDLAGFRLRYAVQPGEAWVDSIVLTDGLLTTTAFPGASLPVGTREVMVKAETTGGIQSVTEARLVVTPGDVFDRIRFGEVDFKASGFQGMITGGSVQGGVLKALDTSSWLDPANGPWLSPASGQWLDPNWTTLEWRTNWTAPVDMMSTDRVAVEYTGSGVIEIFYRRGGEMLVFLDENAPIPENLLAQLDDLPLGAFFEEGVTSIYAAGIYETGIHADIAGVSANPWIPWRQSLALNAGETINILVRVRSRIAPALPTEADTSAAAFAPGVFAPGVFASTGLTFPEDPEPAPTIKTFTVYADAAEIEEVLSVVEIPPGGRKLPVSRGFRGIRYVLHTLHGGSLAENTAAVSIKVWSLDANGPFVIAETADGGSVAATATFQLGGW